MYIYKRQAGQYKLVDYIDSKEEYDIEERIILLLRKTKEYKRINNITSQFTGHWTVYYFGGKYAYIVSPYKLSEDGSIVQ